MTLAKCTECGADVSTKGKACPKCGAIPPRRTGRFTLLVAGLFGIAVLASIFGGSKEPGSKDAASRVAESPAQVAERAAERERISLARQVGKAVKAGLRDPDSLKFRVLGVSADASTACGQYQAKNGFGGMVQEAIIIVNSKAVGFTKAAWQKHCTGLQDYLVAAP